MSKPGPAIDISAFLKLMSSEAGPAPVIPEGADWQFVRDAFDAFHLDAKDSKSWLVLLGYLAGMYFKAPPGAPRQWTDNKLGQLLDDFLTVKSEHPGKSDARVCELLRSPKRFNGRYADMNASTIRRKLQDARASR